MKSNLFKNSILLIIASVLPKLVSIITIPLYTYFLTKTDYGTFDFVLTLSSFFIPLITLQISSGVFRYLVNEQDDSNKKSIITSSSVFIIVVSLIFLVLSIIITKNNFLYSLLIIANAVYQLALEIARGISNKKKYLITSLLNASLLLILTIILINVMKYKLLAVLLSYIIPSVISSIYLIITSKLYKYFSIKHYSKSTLIKLLKYSVCLIPNSISWWVMNVSDRIIISFILGLEYNAIYAVSSKIPSIYSLFYNGFNNAWQESAIVSEDKHTYYAHVFENLTTFLLTGLILLMSIFPVIYKVLVPSSYSSAYNLIPILAISLIFSSLSSFIGGILIADKNTKLIGITSLISAILNIIINLVFIGIFKLYAAAFSTLISFFILFIIRYVSIKDVYNLNYSLNKLLGLSLFLLVSIVIYYLGVLLLTIIFIIIAIVIFVIYNKDMVLKVLKMNHEKEI